MGKNIIAIGLVISIIGLIVHLSENQSWFKYIGNLPGDIRIEKENFKLYAPISTMILGSILLNIIIKLWQHFKS